MIIYIAGPMTGLPDNNYPAFKEAAEELGRHGHTILNPADNPVCSDWLGYMRLSLKQIADCDIIYALPGWNKSKGASIEMKLAFDLGIPTRNYYAPRKS